MPENTQKKKERSVLDYLMEDSSMSVGDIASEMGTYRQKVWKKKK